MSNKKVDIIEKAYSRMRISGLTVNPGARENKLALGRLERMAARWKKKNICAGYNFEDEPDINSDSGVEEWALDAFEACLAFWLSSDFGKIPPPTLVQEKSTAYSDLSSATATPRQTNYPSRQPRGRGNQRYRRWNHYYLPVQEAPNECATNSMKVDDVDDFTEHFDSYLRDSEEISTYTIEADDGLTIVSDSLTSPDINYRIKAVGNSEDLDDLFLVVKIVATTTTGRIETRLINFSVKVT